LDARFNSVTGHFFEEREFLAMQQLRHASLAFGFVLCAAAHSVFAQAPAAAPQQPAPAQSAPAAPAQGDSAPQSGSVAIIDTRAFSERITEFRDRLEGLEREFRPTTDTLQKMAAEIQSEEETLQRTAGGLEPSARQKRIEALEAKKKDFTRRREDFGDTFNKRLEIVVGPVKEKIAKAMDAYAKARNITLMIDVGLAAQNNGLIYTAPGMDVTEEFITQYNQSNPVKK
jgi:outer membrane protein